MSSFFAQSCLSFYVYRDISLLALASMTLTHEGEMAVNLYNWPPVVDPVPNSVEISTPVCRQLLQDLLTRSSMHGIQEVERHY